MRPALLALPLLALAASARAYSFSVSLPVGPAYAGLASQVASRNGEDFRPLVRDWRDRGLSFHDLADNLRVGEPAKLLILVRRASGKPRAARAARKVLGKAADLVDPGLRNVLTVDEYLRLVVDDLNAMNKADRTPYDVDFGALRGRIDADLKGAAGAVYVLRSGGTR